VVIFAFALFTTATACVVPSMRMLRATTQRCSPTWTPSIITATRSQPERSQPERSQPERSQPGRSQPHSSAREVSVVRTTQRKTADFDVEQARAVTSAPTGSRPIGPRRDDSVTRLRFIAICSRGPSAREVGGGEISDAGTGSSPEPFSAHPSGGGPAPAGRPALPSRPRCHAVALAGQAGACPSGRPACHRLLHWRAHHAETTRHGHANSPSRISPPISSIANGTRAGRGIAASVSIVW